MEEPGPIIAFVTLGFFMDRRPVHVLNWERIYKNPESYLFASSDFSEAEFDSQLTIEKLYKAIVADRYKGSIKDNNANEPINSLNELLEVPNFYDLLRVQKPAIVFPENITDLVNKTTNYRSKSFPGLNDEEKHNIKRLNRLLLEETYPQETPESLFSKTPYSDSAKKKRAKIAKEVFDAKFNKYLANIDDLKLNLKFQAMFVIFAIMVIWKVKNEVKLPYLDLNVNVSFVYLIITIGLLLFWIVFGFLLNERFSFQSGIVKQKLT